MTGSIAAPRLLPATIAMLAIVLAAKSVWLVQSLLPGGQPGAMITTAAAAAGHEGVPEKAAAVKPEAKPVAESPAPLPSSPEPSPAAEATPAVSEAEKSVLLDLRQRRQELEARDAAITSRESTLNAAEAKISARAEELQDLRKKLEGLDASQKAQNDGAWQGLVKVYEAMKPRDAAAIFNDLSMPVLQSLIGRMKEAKAAAVLAAMTPDRAREVTTKLARSRTQTIDGPQAAETPPAAKPAPQGAQKPAGSGT